MAAVNASEGIDQESLRTERQASHSLTSKREGVSLSYCVSLTVAVKTKSESGKEDGGREDKLIVDDACGTVAPGQV